MKMKTTTTYRTVSAALTAAVLILAACNNPALPGTPSGETIPEGMGLARIRLNAGAPAQSVRTTAPDLSGLYFTLDFTAGETTVQKTLSGPPPLTVTLELEPAVWTLAVKGYADSDHTQIKVSGSISVPITAGTLASFDVYLTPDFSSAGTGSLSYSIGFPAGVRAWLGLYPIDETPGTSQEVDISADAGGTASGDLSNLAEGSYWAVIDLYDAGTNKARAWTGAVHIYGGLPTTLSQTFTPADFFACPPVVGDSATTLKDKLDAALGSPAGSYTVVLDGSETDLTFFEPQTLNVTGKNINITLRGAGSTVQVDRTGTPLFTLGAASGSTLSLALQDITLKGKSGNSVPVIRVNNRGTLSLKAGSRITGNTSSSGGGVYVYYGSFTMSGGAVSGNTASSSSSSSSSYGGGVYVSSGSFTMSGGAVSGNTSSSDGGGVYVGSSGTFTMSGGAVSGNISSSFFGGGGVYVSNGSFTMSGGAVSGNTSSFSSYSTFNRGGGGVYVSSGSFTMSGGAVSGNTSSSSSSPSPYGGGVYVGGGSFTMSGGAVSGNILSGTYSYAKEVLLFDGTFNISGSARPERVFLRNNTRYITISGPLSGGAIIPIDLGVTSSAPIANWVNQPILLLDSTYSAGNLASLKDQFTLGDAKRTDSSTAGTAITGYQINDNGEFVAE
jgi:hypothetical protein